MTIDLSEFKRPPKRCSIGRTMLSMEPDDREKLEAAFAEPSILTVDIFNWIRAKEFVTSKDSVRDHRNQKCACYA